MKKIYMEVVKELNVEVQAFKQGISQEKAKRKATMWGYVRSVPGLIFFYFLFKNQFWPMLRPYVRDYLP